MEEIFEWPRVLMNELPFSFLLEVIFRVAVMFLLLLILLRLAGKRGVKQLSVFEMVIIIALGSAVGDPMLYENVGLLPGIIVIIMVIILYRIITVLAAKFKPLERFIEGQPKLIIEHGQFVLDSLNKEHLAQDEFYSQLRLKSVEHLGQIKYAYLETTGDISTFFNENDQVTYGLPIYPELVQKSSAQLNKKSYYSCTFCGHSQYIETTANPCARCGKDKWVESMNTIRIA
ncbi:MAG: YetF domain-containing protein [Gelidibacter sp.]